MALSAAASLTKRNMSGMTRRTFIVKTGATIYQDAIVVLTAAGKAKPAANETTTRFVGIATANCAAGDGTVTVTVIENLEVLMPATGLTAGDTAISKVYAVDDAKAYNLATLGPEIGVITQFVSATQSWVRLRGGVIVKAS